MDFYSWAVDLPNYKLGSIPNLNSEKKITFDIGGSEHSFNLKGSHEVFQEVYDASAGTNATN